MSISRRQLAALFLCSLVPYSVGNGLLPLLPVYAKQLGANAAVSGYYLAFAYVAITLGAFSAGWVSDRLHRRKLPLIIASLIGVPVIWLMGQVRSVSGLMIDTSLSWYFGGLNLALIAILTGLSVGENERGRIFGILAVTTGLGGLIGGLAVGWLVDRWGYSPMFTCVALFSAWLPLAALLLEEKDAKPKEARNIPDQKVPGLGRNFYWLFTASLLSSIVGFFALLIRSIVMSDLSFSPLEITSTGAIGGLMAMPFPLLMGWLSDRIGRKSLLFAGYAASLASFVLLAFSRELWSFWLVFVGQGIATGATGIGNALVTDLVPRESLGRGLAIFGSATWIGGMAGFATAGYMLQNLGFGPTFVTGGCLALAAIALLIPIQTTSRQVTMATP